MPTAPTVSICLPNLNGRIYLKERFDTIFDQTLTDWELIIYDSYSDDGAWEYIQERARGEDRIRVSEGPREGIYPAWNHCIRQTRGEYVYIATSDDTMVPDCLSRMVATLAANPDCGLCQCELVLIDENSVPFPPARQWPNYTLGAYNPDLVSRRHKRLAPHDGLAHPALFTIYTSVTQLLIRRSVFERVGLFDGSWGSISDFEWGMRAGLVENCVYIPEPLATWRIHAHQATQNVNTEGVRLKMIEMARMAFARATRLPGNQLADVDIEEFVDFLERDVVELGYLATDRRSMTMRLLLRELRHRPRHALEFFVDWAADRRRWGQVRSGYRYERFDRLLRKYRVPSPLFY